MSAPDEILRGRDPDELPRDERHQLLSAYMDDELPPDEARIVTHWLDDNPGALREVEHIRRTWDLLDHYEDEPVPEGFAARVLDAAGSAGRVVPMAWYRQPLAWTSAAAAVLVAVGVTLFAMGAGRGPISPTDRGVVPILDTVPDELLEHVDQLVELDAETFEAVLMADYEDFTGDR